MHPAYSVIVFTTASGAGYGLLFWLGLGHAAGLLPAPTWIFFVAIALSLLLITVGLLSSTLHLAHPDRPWRAFSQWPSSWLPREGGAAVVTSAPAGLLALASLAGIESGWTQPLGLLSALGALATVVCTAMIYACLPTIRQWNLALVPVVYLALAAASGALLLACLFAMSGYSPGPVSVLALVSLAGAALAKIAWLKQIDADRGDWTMQVATGLGKVSIRQLDPPHTRPNFVMREMGYAIARKHALKLRQIMFAALFAAPALLLVLSLAVPFAAPFMLTAAVVSAGTGLLVERWLFFAEATHVSMLYYGLQRA